MRIGPYELENNLMLAPMAGVTDRPFRQLCKRLGAGLVVSEMLSSNPKVWNTAKSQARMNHEGEEGIRSVQIAGADPELMAQAAQFNVENGAQIIDINMGCPDRSIEKQGCGSAMQRRQNRPLGSEVCSAWMHLIGQSRSALNPRSGRAFPLSYRKTDGGPRPLPVLLNRQPGKRTSWPMS